MSSFQVPPSMADFIQVSTATAADIQGTDLFERKFGGPPPDYGHHIIAWYQGTDPSQRRVASYLHLWTQERIGLIGGGCTDGRVMASIPDEQSAIINREGGLLRQTLLFTFCHFSDNLDAFFGHCGDERAKAIDLAAGFQETRDAHLLVNWVNPTLNEGQQDALLQQALDIGPF